MDGKYSEVGTEKIREAMDKVIEEGNIPNNGRHLEQLY